MKKKLLYIMAVVICLSIMTNGTLAYTTVSDTARNAITSYGVSVKIVEQKQLDNGQLKPYPEEAIMVMPSTTVSKIVSVQNNEAPAWVRMRYTMTVTDAAGNPRNLSQEELEQVILITNNSKDWVEEDGWFYYNTVLDAGELTTPLFEEVTFSGPNMDNSYQLNKLKINIEAQGVQRANNGATLEEVLGWPEG